LPEFLPAMKSSELADGTMAGVEVGGVRVLLSRFGGEVYAVSAVCTHEETDLGNGFLIEDRVVCPLHLSQFDLRTGAVQNPPATLPLKHFNVKIDGDAILVEI